MTGAHVYPRVRFLGGEVKHEFENKTIFFSRRNIMHTPKFNNRQNTIVYPLKINKSFIEKVFVVK